MDIQDKREASCTALNFGFFDSMESMLAQNTTSQATWPDVMTIRPLASSRLSAIMLPLEKYLVSLRRINCSKYKIFSSVALQAMKTMIVLLHSQDLRQKLYRFQPQANVHSKMLCIQITSAANNVRISLITPTRKEIWCINNVYRLSETCLLLKPLNSITFENKLFSIFLAMDNFKASGRALSSIFLCFMHSCEQNKINANFFTSRIVERYLKT
jgi:hypothetical protein